ncbi:MAG: phosphoribosylanthranilate isomerase [Lachnospiraceae bacterium]|nr:phosphoribosylanthranilate isomerase [Lachnospiraceae bacterium]
MKLKICGLKRIEDIEYANLVKPDYVGFVFAGNKRRITYDMAERLKEKLSADIKAVGVFVNEPLKNIADLLERNIIDIAQLHGDESEEDVKYIKSATGKKVIKAVRVRSRCDAEAWLDSSADYLLFDSGAGSGITLDWSLLCGIDRKYFLAGGLTPDNIACACMRLTPYAVDLSSGVETDGVKDFEKMRRTVETVRKLSYTL